MSRAAAIIALFESCDKHFCRGTHSIFNKKVLLYHDSNLHNSIPRYGDVCTFKYICIKQSDNVPRLRYFTLSIGHNNIIRFCVDFLKETVKDFITIIGNTILYKFPRELLCESIKLMCLQYHEVSIYLDFGNRYSNNIILEKSVYIQYKFLDDETRRNLRKSNNIKILCYKILQTHKESYEGSMTNTIYHVLHPTGPTNGFLIQCDNIDNVKNIKMFINNDVLLGDDNAEIFMFTKQYSKTALYIPLIDNNDIFCKDFTGSLNINKNIKVKICITFYEPIDKFSIYSLMPNQLRYSSGMAGIKYVNDTFGTFFQSKVTINFNESHIKDFSHLFKTYGKSMDNRLDLMKNLYIL